MLFENHTNLILKKVDTGIVNSVDGESSSLSSKIKRKHIVKKGVSYEILTYDKEMVCFDDDETAKFRSVVCDPATRQILSFSPAKSVEYSTFKENVDIKNVLVNEIVEGTMIQLFYDFRIEKWEIATKGNVGGNYWFYRMEYANPENGNYNEVPAQKTFRDMFLDAFQWDKSGNLMPQTEINDIELFNEFPKYACYTFVLQHPDNHIVGNHEFPAVYLVAVHKIHNRSIYGEMCEYVDGKWKNEGDIPSIEICMPDEYNKWPCMKMGAVSPILFPNSVYVNSYEELEIKLNELEGAFPMGYMLLDTRSGNRAHLENPEYVELKALRGNNPNMQFQYFSLLRAGKVNDYLFHFPMYKTQFHNFEMQYKTFITRVHQSYLSYYVKKGDGIIKKKYFIHASKIHHTVYLPSLNKKDNTDGNVVDGVNGIATNENVPVGKEKNNKKPKNKREAVSNKKVITLNVVREYFDAMPPQNIIYYLNYELRK